MPLYTPFPKEIYAERYTVRQWAYDEGEVVYYIRPTGSDSSDGRSPSSAFKTLERALREFPIVENNKRSVIDVTGMSGSNAITGSYVLNLGGGNLGGHRYNLDVTALSPNNFYEQNHKIIRSELAHVLDLDVVSQTFSSTAGLLTITVNNTLTTNQLWGMFVVGSQIAQYGAIRSHTVGAGPNTIVVANTVAMTAPLKVYEPGAHFRFGDASNFYEQAIYLKAMTDWTFKGIRFGSNSKSAAITVFPSAPVVFSMCQLDGIQLWGGPGITTIESCHVRSKTFAQDGGSGRVMNSVFTRVTFSCHGSGDSGLNEWIGVGIDGSTPFGGGNVESRYTFQADNMIISHMKTNGVESLYGTSRLRNCQIYNCSGSAVVTYNQTSLYMTNVQGGGNTRYGLYAVSGSQVTLASNTAVSGTLANVFIGSLGTKLWSEMPVTDTTQLVRVSY